MANSFSADIEAFAQKLGKTLHYTQRSVILKLFNSVIMDTPWDKGQLRANWNISKGTPDESVSAATDPTGASARARVFAHQTKIGDVTYLTNAMPYAMVAEMGWWGTGSAGEEDSKVTPEGFSKKSPAGMVRRNVARIESIISSSVTESKQKAGMK